jgi:hypothetical protein
MLHRPDLQSPRFAGMLALKRALICIVAVIAAWLWVDVFIGHVTIASPSPRQSNATELTADLKGSVISPNLGCTPIWKTVPSPRPGALSGLRGVAALSPSDIWAVGYYRPSFQGPRLTLTLHWDGGQWNNVPSPNLGTSTNVLTGVAAVSPDDVWAVGFYSNGADARTLILHWNGTEWLHVPSPNPGSGQTYLEAVTAISANDIWAVGDYNYPSSQTLTLHWDGTQWSHVPSPSWGLLRGVTAVASNDVWAVGLRSEGSPYRTITMRWDGSAWNLIPSPNPGDYNELNGVSAASASEAWAVGFQQTGTQAAPLAMRWDGTQWGVIPVPTPPPYSGVKLYDVSILSSSNVWAVGQSIAHWDGTGWNLMRVEEFGRATLFGVEALSPADIWAAGEADITSEGGLTLVKRYTGQCPTSTATPIPTSTSIPTVVATHSPTRTQTALPTGSPTPSVEGSATNTPISTTTSTNSPIPATGTMTTPTNTHTPTAIPTQCTIMFSDVPEGSTFYPYIRCMACRGIISGYADGTFRPGNLVTRGQLSKIVSEAAGFSEIPADWTFQDVPPDSTFYLFIERLSSRGIIGGYPCGSEGEPCVPPLNRPYFRPYSNATRGQIAKIVAVAANFTEIPPGQTFEDVPTSNPFYLWIERLAGRGIIGGYPCGSPGEPCVPPLSRPYFRWGNNATRGQTSKIVANTFLPGCE